MSLTFAISASTLTFIFAALLSPPVHAVLPEINQPTATEAKKPKLPAKSRSVASPAPTAGVLFVDSKQVDFVVGTCQLNYAMDWTLSFDGSGRAGRQVDKGSLTKVEVQKAYEEGLTNKIAELRQKMNDAAAEQREYSSKYVSARNSSAEKRYERRMNEASANSASASEELGNVQQSLDRARRECNISSGRFPSTSTRIWTFTWAQDEPGLLERVMLEDNFPDPIATATKQNRFCKVIEGGAFFRCENREGDRVDGRQLGAFLWKRR